MTEKKSQSGIVRTVAVAALLVTLGLAVCLICQSGGEPKNDSQIAGVPSPMDTPTVLETYATVIGEYYTVLHDGWDAEAVMAAGMNPLVADAFFEAPLEDIGYAVTDLDGDGAEELIIGSRREDGLYGKLVIALYTLREDGTPMPVFQAAANDRYYYAGGIRFANLGECDWTYVTTLKLQNREMVDMTYTTDPADYVQMDLTPFSQWVRQEEVK